MAFSPFEVDMRQTIGPVPHVSNRAAKCVRDRGAAQGEDPVAAVLHITTDVEMAGEFGWDRGDVPMKITSLESVRSWSRLTWRNLSLYSTRSRLSGRSR